MSGSVAQPFEALLANLMAELAATPLAGLDAAIVEALARLCRLLDAERASLWLGTVDSPRGVRLTHARSVREGDQDPPVVGVLAEQAWPWIVAQVVAGRVVVVPDVADLPVEAERDRQAVALYGDRSLLVVPFGDESLRGALAFTTVTRQRSWPDVVVARARLVAELLRAVLDRQRTEERTRRERALLLALIDARPGDLVWCVDPADHGLVVWNAAAERHIAEHAGRGPRAGDRPEDLTRDGHEAARWHALYDRARAEGAVTLAERAPDGRRLRLSLRRVLREGRCAGVSVFAHDDSNGSAC